MRFGSSHTDPGPAEPLPARRQSRLLCYRILAGAATADAVSLVAMAAWQIAPFGGGDREQALQLACGNGGWLPWRA
ncbi:hypothetical protein [Streptomyces sp. Ncost-T10-10d]|uniref:hypothetical protein n=1 Tax=Streptomyces sp. Ncost-T10-10d TaxID=1839774 RepID=UPI00081E7586|nr:hypothetical protein [Streptomyces sp. Ncost-T10-10d]SCF71654.1 hypothetical protein GA0115254_112631 [Streptomyces sp. Ncost-T10-10d]